jgi:uncharacterized protein with GYD domain
MATYLMLGKYSPAGIAGASPARTKEITDLLSQCGGKVDSMYALTGDQDLAFFVEFPSTEDVLRASFEVARSTGISFVSNEAVPVAQFDRVISTGTDAAKGPRRQVTVRA